LPKRDAGLHPLNPRSDGHTMKKDTDHLSRPQLRQRAEDFLNQNPAAIKRTPPADIQKLVEELRVHQVELEMQNEELRQAQIELSDARDRYANLYDFAPVGYFTINEKGLILEANFTGAKMLGLERGRLIGRPFSRFITKDAQDNFYLYRKKIFETGIRQTFELTLKREDGSIFHAQLESIAIKETGADGNVIRTTIIDITRRRQAEEEKTELQFQLQHSQKMEAVGTLAGGIAHDFNNLLQAIQGFAEILLLDKQKNDDGYHELKQISHAAKRGAELTRQLLTFSHKIESKLRPVDINDLVEKTKTLLERTLPRMIAIKLRLTPENMVVNADSAQIEQILINLAVNAKDAMPEGGELTVQTEGKWLDEAYCRVQPLIKPGKYVLLTVSDSGCGMDKETLKHIFDPFYTTKGLAEGTGLGLAIVYGIVKSHGGHIECVSALGMSTSFRIYFPALDQQAPTEVAAKEDRPGGGSETILLVDDEEIIRDVGEATLTRFGYTVLTAADGDTAVERYRREQERIDLVILDLVMPKMSGKRCLEALIRINPNVKVVVASGFSETVSRAEVLKAGAKGFIGKPYEVNKLLSAVREVLDER
jgi:two-component system cell cycle sensor histidine kinase/response regulator CckA